MKCPNCQQETKATKFCTNCGTPLVADAAPKPKTINHEHPVKEGVRDKQQSRADYVKGDHERVQPTQEIQIEKQERKSKHEENQVNTEHYLEDKKQKDTNRDEQLPIQKEPEQPVQKEPEQPVQKEPEQPVQKETEQPVKKETEQPVQETEQPVKEPEQPVQKEPEQSVQKEESNKTESVPQQESTNQKEQNTSEDKKLDTKPSSAKITFNWKLPGKYLLFSGILFFLTAGYSIGMQYIFKGSQMFKDFFYRFLYNVVGIEQDMAVAFASAKTISWWDVLAASFGTTVTGNLTETYIEGQEGSLSFVFHAPLILPSLLMLVLLFIGWKAMKKWANHSAKIRLLEISFISILFSGLLYVLLWALKPNLTYGNLEILFAPKPLSMILSAFLLSLLAGLFAWGPFDFQTNTKFKILSSLKPLKVFFYYFIGLQALVGILMVAVWMLSNPAAIFDFPTLSPSMVWHEYKLDPLFYCVLPNIMLFETFYSVGGSLQISSMELAQALSMQEPIKLNLFTGVSSMLGVAESSEWVQELSRSLRFVWHPYALLVIFLTSLSMARVKGKLSSLLILIGGFSLSAILLTLWMNITFTKVETGETMMIGFQPLQIFISVFILCLIIFAASFSLSHFFEKKVRGTNE